MDVPHDDDGLVGPRVDADDVGLAVEPWRMTAAAGRSRRTRSAESIEGSLSSGRLREHQSSVAVKSATQSRVSTPSSGHSTGGGGATGEGEGGGGGSAAPSGSDMAWIGSDAAGELGDSFPSLCICCDFWGNGTRACSFQLAAAFSSFSPVPLFAFFDRHVCPGCCKPAEGLLFSLPVCAGCVAFFSL